jgi:hypothetical protein
LNHVDFEESDKIIESRGGDEYILQGTSDVLCCGQWNCRSGDIVFHWEVEGAGAIIA